MGGRGEARRSRGVGDTAGHSAGGHGASGRQKSPAAGPHDQANHHQILFWPRRFLSQRDLQVMAIGNFQVMAMGIELGLAKEGVGRGGGRGGGGRLRARVVVVVVVCCMALFVAAPHGQPWSEEPDFNFGGSDYI